MELTVRKIKQEANTCLSLILQKPDNFNFYAGQYLDIELPVNDKNGNTRAFTVSSSPTEDYLMITTRIGLSKFKKALAMLQPGDTIKSSHPAGTFTLDESSPAVFMAGGVGITPFRSMIKFAVDQKLNTSITLIYLNSDGKFLFKKELDNWQSKLPNLTIHYIISGKTGRLNRNHFLKLYPLLFTLYPIFYLAGPPAMVDNFANMLINSGVDETNIRYDRFDGY